ncbi:hypothetical protein LCGC14_2547910 [marine sediment metagenome]|uniref:Uncharacterized protein n=1 Tax=marine sediment metagenome TaxID=412755 RepID=A0A0F9ANS5_9ZZZZ
MPVTKVKSRWDSNGDLVFEDASGNQLLKIADSKLQGDFEASQLKINGVAVTATAAQLNEGSAAHADFTFAAASGAANITEVAVTAKQADGTTTVAAPIVYNLWLSDAATGAGLTATAASGTVTVKSASGAVIGTLTSKKALVVQALATGVFILEITDTGKTAFYVCASTGHGEVKVSAQLVTGDYG